MKRLLTVLVALFVVVSMFAAEKPFTLGPNVKYTGTVSFSLVVDANGVDISGALASVSASLPFGPTSDTQAGATFSISYAPFGGVSLTLQSITFSTPYFGAFYSTGKQFVSDYFTGRVYNPDGTTPWTTAMGDFQDSLKLTLPAVAGLEVYYLDKKVEKNITFFDDMVLVKYPVAGFTVVGALYNATGTTTHEFGAEVKGALDLGIFKPSVTVFGGMVAGTSGMETAYDVIVSGSLTPVTGLTLAPTFKFAEKLDKLEYRSSNIANAKYFSLGVTYTTTFAPVTLTAKVTPKVDFATATPKTTLPLNELSAKVAVTPVTLFVKTTNADLLDSSKKYTLYTEASYSDPMLSGAVKAEWTDITQFATYTYIHANVNVKATPELSVYGNYRMVTGPAKSGYNAGMTYTITPNVKLTGFYGTLTADGDGNFTVINNDPTWNLKLTYSASF